MKDIPEKIVFFDGDCGFCNQSVQFILNFQKDDSLHFSALQSGFTTELFEQNNWNKPDLTCVYFYRNGKLYERSDAALKIASELRIPWSVLPVFWVIPQYIRDKLYDFIAKRRHLIKKDYCLVPNLKQSKQFILNRAEVKEK